MYLRRVGHGSGSHYVIRESYRDNGAWKHRDLVDLGWNPREHIQYTDGNGFFFSPHIEEELHRKEARYTPRELENIFLPFLNARIRRIVESVGHDVRPRNISSACPYEELWSHEDELHSFDKRRMHFLRFGRIDIGNLEGRSWRFLNILLCKGRDEVEATIESMEQYLRPSDIPNYIYTSLHLQRYFPDHLMRNIPIALNPEEIDRFFLEEICRLNGDESFFQGMGTPGNGRIHPILEKYVIMFFDSSFEGRNPALEFMRESMRRRRRHAPPNRRSRTPATEDALVIFGISVDEFLKMKRRDIIRIYWRKAQRMHPDKGGDHEAFVQLNEAYEVLISRK